MIKIECSSIKCKINFELRLKVVLIYLCSIYIEFKDFIEFSFLLIMLKELNSNLI